VEKIDIVEKVFYVPSYITIEGPTIFLSPKPPKKTTQNRTAENTTTQKITQKKTLPPKNNLSVNIPPDFFTKIIDRIFSSKPPKQEPHKQEPPKQKQLKQSEKQGNHTGNINVFMFCYLHHFYNNS